MACNTCYTSGNFQDVMTNEELKAVIFEVYAAGFEVGYSGQTDLSTAFEEWWKTASKEVE